MATTRPNQLQIDNSVSYDDSLTPSVALETGAVDVEDDLNGLRSVIKNRGGATDWYTDFDGSAVNRRTQATLGTDLDAVETKDFLYNRLVLVDITATTVLQALTDPGETPSVDAAVSAGSAGAVATGSANFATARTTGAAVIAGDLYSTGAPNALRPLNLGAVFNGTTGDPVVTTLGNQMKCLLITERATDGPWDNGSNQGAIVFIEINATNSGYIYADAANLPANINYSYTERSEFLNLNEWAFLNEPAADAVAGTDVTMTLARTNQSGPVLPNTKDIDWQIGDGQDFRFEDDGNATIAAFAVSGGGVRSVTLGTASGSDVITIEGTTLDINVTGDMTVFGGIVVEDGANPDIRIGQTASTIDTSTGALNLTGAGGMNITATTGAVAVDAVAASVSINAATTISIGNDADTGAINVGTGAAARTITVGNVTGATSVTHNTGTGGFTVNTTGAGTVDVNSASGVTVDGTGISIDGTAASNFTVTAGNLVLSTITSGELDMTSAGLMDVNAGANLDIDVTGTYDVLATGAGSIDFTGASNLTVTSGNLTVSSATTGSVLVDGVDGVEINSTAGALSIGNDANAFAINVGTGAAARTITVGNATGATTLDFNSGTGGVTIDTVSGGISLDAAAGASNFTVAGANLTVATVTSGDLTLSSAAVWTGTSAGLMDINAGANLDIDVTGTYDMLSSGAFSIDGTGASNVTATSGTLTLSSVTTGNVTIAAADALTIDTASTADSSAKSIAITAGTSSGAANAGANIIVESGGPGAGGTAGIISLRTAVSGNIDSDDPILFIDNQGSGSGGGHGINFYTRDVAADPAFSTISGSLAVQVNAGATPELWMNTTVGTGAGTTWTRMATMTDITASDSLSEAIAVQAGTAFTAGAFNTQWGLTDGQYVEFGDSANAAILTIGAAATGDYVTITTSGDTTVTSSGNILLTADVTEFDVNSQDVGHWLDRADFHYFGDTNRGDNYLTLNAQYVDSSSTTGGTVKVTSAATVAGGTITGSAAGVAAMSNPTLTTSGSTGLAASTLIIIEGATPKSLNGIYEVNGTSGTTVTLRGVGTSDTVEFFTKRQVEASATGGTIYTVTVAVMRNNTSGTWQVGGGSTTGITYSDLSTGSPALQASYAAGNTISVITADGTIDFSNSTDTADTLTVSHTFAGAGDALTVNMGATSTGQGIDVNITAGATGNAVDIANAGGGDALFINNTSTGAAFTVQDGGVDVLDVTAAGAVTVTPTSGTNFTVTTAGTGDVDINVGDAFTVDAAGAFSIDATGAASNVTVTGFDLTVATVTTGNLTLTGAVDATLQTADSAVGAIGTVYVYGGDASSGADNGGSIQAVTGTATGGNSSGSVVIRSADAAAAASAQSGGVSISTGTSADSATAGTTGGIDLSTGGPAFGATYVGGTGDISFSTGGAIGETSLANSGTISISTGDVNDTGGIFSGAINISTGSAGGASNGAGNLSVFTGTSTVDTGEAAGGSGHISITASNNTGTASAGKITVTAGANDGTGITGTVSIIGGAKGTSNGAGGAAGMTGGAGFGTGAGGAASLTGGAAGATGVGGAVTLAAAAGGATSGVGGAFSAVGGAGTASNSAGGTASVTGGAGQGTASGGVLTLASGTGGATGSGATTTLRGGHGGGTSGAAGGANVTGGTPVDGNGGDVTISATAGVGTNRSGGNVTVTSGTYTGTGTAGVVTIGSPSGGLIGQSAVVLTLDNNGSGTGGGEVASVYLGTAAPTHSANTGSVFLFDNGTTGRVYVNQSSGGSGTTWSQVQTQTTTVTRNFFQDTLDTAVAAGGNVDASDFTGGFIAVKPSSGFTFNTDAQIFLNGVLLMNGATNDIASGTGNTLDIPGTANGWAIGDVITIIYYTNSTNTTA